MARLEDAKRFNFRCPYRDIPCTEFNCEVCEIEEEERRWMEESEGESRIIAGRKEKKVNTLVAFIIGLSIGAFVGVGFGCILTALMFARGNNRDRFDG